MCLSSAGRCARARARAGRGWKHLWLSMTRRWYTCAHAGTSVVRCSGLVSPTKPFSACPEERSNQRKPLYTNSLGAATHGTTNKPNKQSPTTTGPPAKPLGHCHFIPQSENPCQICAQKIEMQSSPQHSEVCYSKRPLTQLQFPIIHK